MDREKVSEIIEGLAHSQGFYRRLLETLYMADDANERLDQFGDCADVVDVIMSRTGGQNAI